MDKEYVSSLEEKCIQECVPGCRSLCPLHVDARAMASAQQEDDFSQALKIYEKQVVFPGILSRICDAPCLSGCLRKDFGGAVSIPRLEEAAVLYGRSSGRQFRILRKRSEKVAVVGGGLCGLSAAVALFEKGYEVHLYEKKSFLGGRTRELGSDIITHGIIDEDLAVLKRTGINIHTEHPVQNGELQKIRNAFPAVLIASGNIIDGLSGESLETDEETLITGVPGIFAAGTLRRSTYSPSFSVAEGRRAAISIDRFLQKVSLSAGREGELPFESCLYTNTEKVIFSEAVVPVSGGSLSRSEAFDEAKRCLLCECMECVKACKLLEYYESYPRRYVRELSNSVNQFYGVRKTKHMLNGCTDCGLCAELCPNGLSMGDLCTIGKRELVGRGIMPPAVHDFPVQDMLDSNSPGCSLSIFHDGAEYVYFPGCQMQALMPDLLVKSYESIVHLTGKSAGIYLGCCGAPADWAGRLPMRNGILEKIRNEWEQAGSPVIIYACTSCRKTLSHVIADSKLISLWEFLDEKLSDGMLPAVEGLPSSLAVADPCTGRHLSGVQKSVRNLFERQGCSPVELEYSGELTRCCGFGGLVSLTEPEIGRRITHERIAESSEDYGVYCVMCQDNFQSEGKKTYHLLELLYGPSRNRREDGKRIPYSLRQDNRRRACEEVRVRWGGGSRAAIKEEWEYTGLIIPAEVFELMEERMILVRDLQKVVFEAEKTGRRIYNPKTGRYSASLNPGVVTYWAEYAPEDGQYRVYNAYSHRLEVME